MKKTLYLILAVSLILLCSCSGKDKKENEPFQNPAETKQQTEAENAKEEINENVVLPDFDKEELDEKFGTDEIYIVKTYMESPIDEFEQYLDENKIFTRVKHYQLSDGTWKTDEHSYKYKLELKGRMNNAAKDSTFEILSNNPNITFDQAWKAAGYSSNSEDYFKPEDAIIVAVG